MQLKYLLTVLRTMKIRGLFSIMRDWQALVRMHFIYAAHESGLLEALSTPASRDDLIQKPNVKRPEILEALLDVGLSAKELAYEKGSYSIKGKTIQSCCRQRRRYARSHDSGKCHLLQFSIS